MRRTLYPFLSIRALCKRGNAHRPRHSLLFKKYFQYCCCQNKVLRLIIARHLGGVNENKKILLDFLPNECSVGNGFTARFLRESGYNKAVKTVLLTVSGRVYFYEKRRDVITKLVQFLQRKKNGFAVPLLLFRFRFIAEILIPQSKSLRLPDV